MKFLSPCSRSNWSTLMAPGCIPGWVTNIPLIGSVILFCQSDCFLQLYIYFILNLIAFFRYLEMEQLDWQNKITEPIKGMLVTHPGMHPGAMRVDQLDREQDDKNVIKYPEIVHFGTRPQQLCYAGNAEYQKVWREYIKFRHLLANMPKPTFKVCIYFLISDKLLK